MVHQLKFDSVHTTFEGTVTAIKNGDKELLVVNGKEIPVFHEKDPAAIKSDETGAEYICESTGRLGSCSRRLDQVSFGSKSASWTWAKGPRRTSLRHPRQGICK